MLLGPRKKLTVLTIFERLIFSGATAKNVHTKIFGKLNKIIERGSEMACHWNGSGFSVIFHFVIVTLARLAISASY